MKLADLRGAMRKTKGNPSIVVELVPGRPMTLVMQKTVLLEELGRIFDGSRAAETGLMFDEDTGILSVEGAAAQGAITPIVDAAAQSDVESGGLDLDLDYDDDLL